MVTKVPILIYYNQGLKVIVKIDFFEYHNNKVFFQLGEDELLHFVTFFSKNKNLAKCNYMIYNNKLLDIIQYFEQ